MSNAWVRKFHHKANIGTYINKYSENAKSCKALVSMYINDSRGCQKQNKANKVRHDIIKYDIKKYVQMYVVTSKGTP